MAAEQSEEQAQLLLRREIGLSPNSSNNVASQNDVRPIKGVNKHMNPCSNHYFDSPEVPPQFHDSLFTLSDAYHYEGDLSHYKICMASLPSASVIESLPITPVEQTVCSHCSFMFDSEWMPSTYDKNLVIHKDDYSCIDAFTDGMNRNPGMPTYCLFPPKLNNQPPMADDYREYLWNLTAANDFTIVKPIYNCEHAYPYEIVLQLADVEIRQLMYNLSTPQTNKIFPNKRWFGDNNNNF